MILPRFKFFSFNEKDKKLSFLLDKIKTVCSSLVPKKKEKANLSNVQIPIDAEVSAVSAVDLTNPVTNVTNVTGVTGVTGGELICLKCGGQKYDEKEVFDLEECQCECQCSNSVNPKDKNIKKNELLKKYNLKGDESVSNLVNKLMIPKDEAKKYHHLLNYKFKCRSCKHNCKHLVSMHASNKKRYNF